MTLLPGPGHLAVSNSTRLQTTFCMIARISLHSDIVNPPVNPLVNRATRSTAVQLNDKQIPQETPLCRRPGVLISRHMVTSHALRTLHSPIRSTCYLQVSHSHEHQSPCRYQLPLQQLSHLLLPHMPEGPCQKQSGGPLLLLTEHSKPVEQQRQTCSNQQGSIMRIQPNGACSCAAHVCANTPMCWQLLGHWHKSGTAGKINSLASTKIQHAVRQSAY